MKQIELTLNEAEAITIYQLLSEEARLLSRVIYSRGDILHKRQTRLNRLLCLMQRNAKATWRCYMPR